MLLFRLAGTNGKTQFSGPQGWKTQLLGRQTTGAAQENGITANGSCGPTPAQGLDRSERAGFFDDRARPARIVGLGGKIDLGCVAGEMAGSGMKLKNHEPSPPSAEISPVSMVFSELLSEQCFHGGKGSHCPPLSPVIPHTHG